MRVKTRAVEGEAAVWDPADPEPFRRMAGDRFLREEGGVAIVTTGEGALLCARPGWLVIALDAAPGTVRFSPPGNFGTSDGCEWEPA